MLFRAVTQTVITLTTFCLKLVVWKVLYAYLT